jgi:hypothetical protein
MSHNFDDTREIEKIFTALIENELTVLYSYGSDLDEQCQWFLGVGLNFVLPGVEK